MSFLLSDALKFKEKFLVISSMRNETRLNLGWFFCRACTKKTAGFFGYLPGFLNPATNCVNQVKGQSHQTPEG